MENTMQRTVEQWAQVDLAVKHLDKVYLSGAPGARIGTIGKRSRNN